MGKISKSSRKGKKAWRANISTEDIEDYFDKSTKDALSGGSLANLPTDSLFYVHKSIGEQKTKPKKMRKPSVIAAVEIEPNGCSFNPPSESHQDSLAIAVADEMQKIYRKELGPDPVPLIVPGEVIDEESMYFLDADDGTDDDVPNEDLMESGDTESEKRPLKPKMVTRVQLNRRVRHKEQWKAGPKAERKKQLSKEIACRI